MKIADLFVGTNLKVMREKNNSGEGAITQERPLTKCIA